MVSSRNSSCELPKKAFGKDFTEIMRRIIKGGAAKLKKIIKVPIFTLKMVTFTYGMDWNIIRLPASQLLKDASKSLIP